MTKEEILKEFEDINFVYNNCSKHDTLKRMLNELVEEYQEPVLEKIRAEITAIVINGQIDEHTAFIRTGEQVKQMVLDVIDRYKAESEK